MTPIILRQLRGVFAVVVLAQSAGAQWVAQSSGTTGEFRGLSVVSPGVAWASGVRGTVVHTTDGGAHWAVDTIPGAGKLDLRAIAATSTMVAHAMSIADSSRIFRTTDGGKTWSERFVFLRKGSFLDAIRFWDEKHGIAISDPVDGRFLVVTTGDGGETWKEVAPEGLPLALPNEGAFAASGSCLAVYGQSDAWFATGGATSARVYHSTDRGRHWTVSDTPIRVGAVSTGIFSVDFRDATHGVISGGDYAKPKLGGRNLAFTSDGGKNWALVDSTAAPQGFLSSVAFQPNTLGRTLIATGLNGTSLSTDNGRTWTLLDSVAYNSAQFGSRDAYIVGPRGRVAKYSLDR